MARTRQAAALKKVPEPDAVKAHHTIVSLEPTGGFLKGAKFEFADGLNCIIGGRGTGKTTVLEFVRYVLGLMPDERASSVRARSIKTLLQSNLGNGRLRLQVRTKHGMGYLAERPWNDTAQILNEQGEATAVSFERDNIFKADIYSQNEIEEIATNPSHQLALLDKFIEEDVRRIEAEIRKVARDLEQNASDLLRLNAEIGDLRDSASEEEALKEKLKAFQKAEGPDAKLVNASHARKALRERERKALEVLGSDLPKARQDFQVITDGIVRRIESRIEQDALDGINGAVFALVRQQVQELRTVLESAAAKVVSQIGAAEAVVSEQQTALVALHVTQEAEYRALLAKTQEEVGRATERSQLQQRFADVTAARKELDLREKERRDAEAERLELLAKLSNLRDERFQLRKKVADELSEELRPEIRVTITQAENNETYRELLTEALKGQSMKHSAVVERIAGSKNATPSEFSVLVQRKDWERLAARTGLDEDRAKRVVEVLHGSEMLYRLETVELEDKPRIELLDGKSYKDSAELSTGQRCTTVLPILLRESERPLLIDQPEDNLDNKYIFDTVVRTLKAAKGRRQLIFVTHNPNIPVLGDAERVFVLTSDGKQSTLERVGTVDEAKDAIESVLEGGSEAFQLRMQRYGH
jgi:hypothetical protein